MSEETIPPQRGSNNTALISHTSLAVNSHKGDSRLKMNACSGRSHVWCHERNVGYLHALFDGAVLWKYNTFEMSVNFQIAEREKNGQR